MDQQPKTLTPQQALERLINSCSRYETSTTKVKQKLRDWKIEASAQEEIVQQLLAQKFVDDARYAKNFARTKSKYAKWGIVKIKTYLQAQHLDLQIIEQALSEIDQEEEPTVLEELLLKKIPLLKYKSDMELVAKLMRFALIKGYRYADASAVVKKILYVNLKK